MNTNFNNQIANQYTSNSQKIRVLTEDWVDREIFCPACGNNIDNYENNRPVADFFCPTCKEEYELKSKKNSIGSKIVDGAYKTMIERLQSNNNPNFFLLNYNIKNYSIQNFFVIPKHFFVPEIIEKRKPLSDTARRAGWIGCNILLKTIPQTGKIFYIKNQKAESKSKVLNDWQKTLFLREQKEPLSKGWVLDVMNCIDRLEKNEFKLDEVYNFEKDLELKHPGNNHVKDKIRQQLQLLRDKGYLSFVSRGKYKLN
ncbi:restriction endonuclease [Candidatus Falkowbacteria bacterium RIFOXYD2_FULL_34_120]|uniref:Restriction endonuclease n=1 Tax=Candidatus Falkowbacteria bacterium RIFOXYD2_FULL_34_120 TaxID=1798007 RepID=A0A1F5TMX0_9BACT|nr:MAG: restriction endonuclease [Candidatus Falkowbacteria bacterium RIFOXYC12_FULL_34_55]OGF38004.1 MAG: restriction endonuclease [Candidatus Falkowbacteria bacterium RIFOXYC2_FULL_34_220]OGF38259.1 MAG: restriction endonuclease [Candidatus Falkowbacteria bacterium RIFOXYD12_FULL_34_57]OGF40174.1 MAG: restriction endonuclease [Candidatus Falkowbacteria bacterium RIFOXYD2_FULL_34_120]